MMVIHNLGNIAPPGMEAYPPTGINMFGALCHPSFPMYPGMLETEPFPSAHTFTNAFRFPPALLVASLWTKVFKVSYSLSVGAASVSGTDTLVPVKFGTTDMLTLAERLSDDYSTASAELSDSDSSGGNSITFNLSLPAASDTFWIRSTGSWRLDAGVFIGVGGGKYVGSFVPTADYPETGVTLTYFGETIQLYADRASALGEVSGSITIEAEEYLDPL